LDTALKKPPATPQALADWIVNELRNRLPESWRVRLREEVSVRDERADAVIEFTAPDGNSLVLLVEAKRSVESRDVPDLARQLRELGAELDPSPGAVILAPYLNSGVRERIVEEGLNYADATGNLHLSLNKEPALFIRDAGASRDPWRGPGRPRDSFRGPIAARVVRTLVDFAPPMTVPALIERSEVSTGAGYRVVDFLERQDLVERQPRGPITRADWRGMLERWAQDYELNLAETADTFLAPRGLRYLWERLGEGEESRYVLSGSAAAAHYEEYAQTRMAMLYADDPQQLAGGLDLRPVESNANVLLVRPADPVVYARAQEREGIRIAAPSQVAVDLLNGPGRAPVEAQALLDWMERNESAWRH
jgi:hypothetical protein